MKIIVIFHVLFTHYFEISLCRNVTYEKNFYAHIVNESSVRLHYLGNEIKHHFNTIDDVSLTIANATENYIKEIDALSKVMAKHEIKYELERQLYLLYIVQASNDIFIKISNSLLDDIIASMQNKALEIDYMMLAKVIKKVADDDKRTILMYVCFKLEVCRSYPAVSDHIAELLEQILRLPYSKYFVITKYFKKIMELKLGFYRSIMNDEVAFHLERKLKYIVDRPAELRKWLSFVSEIIGHKLKLFKSRGETINIRTKAIRLLIDIFDKAFMELINDAMGIEFSNVRKAIKDWTVGENKSIKRTVREFCDYIFDALRFGWNSDVKKEVKLLVEILVTGTTTENSILVDDLLYKGSNYLNTGFFVSDVDPIE